MADPRADAGLVIRSIEFFRLGADPRPETGNRQFV